MRDSTRVEEFLKGVNHVGSSGYDPLQFLGEIPTYRNRDLLDRYIKGELAFQLNFRIHNRIRATDSKLDEVTFIFQKVGVQRDRVCDLYRGVIPEPSSRDVRTGDDHVQASMPILTGAVVEQAKSIVDSSIRQVCSFSSVVRLYRLDPVPELLREWSSVDSTLLEFCGIGADGKFKSAFIGGRLGSLIDTCGLINGTIQSRSELIEELAKFEREVVVEFLQEDCSNYTTCPIVLQLDTEFVGFFVKQGVPVALENLSMSYCPVDSFPTLLESLHKHTIQGNFGSERLEALNE